MRRHPLAIVGATVLCLGVTADFNLAQRAQAPAVPPKAAAAVQKTAPPAAAPAAKAAAPAAASAGLMTVEAQAALTKQYCVGCHNPTAKKGDMTLTDLDLAHPEKTPALTEKVIRKLRTGMMPP